MPLVFVSTLRNVDNVVTEHAIVLQFESDLTFWSVSLLFDMHFILLKFLFIKM